MTKQTLGLCLLAAMLMISCGPAATETSLATPAPLPTATPLAADEVPGPTSTLAPTHTPQPAPTATALPTEPPPSPTPLPSPTTPPLDPEEAVMGRAEAAIQALKNRDPAGLAALAHPQQGVRFSPYAFVNDSDLRFLPEQLAGLLADVAVYLWGAYDGSGLPIELSFAEYYERFIYDQDFANAEQVSLNQRIGQGNSLDNSREFYPGAMVVEYHFSGFDPQYAGMDWRSLRLVFQELEGIWYLVGVIHDEWTI